MRKFMMKHQIRQKKYAHEAMSKLETKNINEDVKQAIIDAYIKGIQE